MRSVSKLSFAAIFALLWAVAGSGYGKSYKMYKADWKPLHQDKEAAKKWQTLTDEYKANGMNRENIEARLAIIKPLVKKNPKWADGRWILANVYMQMGETVSADDKDSGKKTRGYLVQAKKHSEKCLKLKPDLAICKFFLGASMGKIGTIDGVMASLSKERKS